LPLNVYRLKKSFLALQNEKAPNLLPKMSARGIGLLPFPRYGLHLFGNPAILINQDP